MFLLTKIIFTGGSLYILCDTLCPYWLCFVHQIYCVTKNNITKFTQLTFLLEPLLADCMAVCLCAVECFVRFVNLVPFFIIAREVEKLLRYSRNFLRQQQAGKKVAFSRLIKVLGVHVLNLRTSGF